MDKCCEMKGFLTFLVLRLIAKQPMSGDDIREELAKRRGTKPSPGTIYPCLKHLVQEGLIEECDGCGKEKMYVLTKEGKQAVAAATKQFVRMFGDFFVN